MRTPSAVIANAVAALCMALVVGCASTAPPEVAPVLRSRAPVNYQQAITSYFDVAIAGPQPGRELNVSKPEPGGCPMGGHISSERGWVVPVVYVTRSGGLTGREPIHITAKEYYFWFRQDTISGVTAKMELCP